jgi:serralysin
MQVQFNQWQSINLQDFSNSFKNVSDSVKSTDAVLTSLSSQYINFYDGSNSTGYGSWGSYNIYVRGSNFLGSSPRATYVSLTSFFSNQKYELNGSVNITSQYYVTGGSFTSLSHTNSSGTKDYSINGSFTYSLGSINGGTITSAEINQFNGKLTVTGTLIINANEVITGGTITSLSYTALDGKSFKVSNVLIDVNELQSVLQSAGTDFSVLSSFLLSDALLTGNDTITGDSENNTLDGGNGVDKLAGGLGDDTYIVDLVRTGTTAANYKVALQDTITEAANAGNDTVQLRLLNGTDYGAMNNATTLTLGANLENLDASLTGSTKLNLTGNALANTLTGNDADNILDGGAGVDTLIGGAGNDTYILDLKLQGTGANATVVIEDTVTELNGTINGIDTVKLRGTATLATAAELSLTGDWANIEILDASATGATKLNLTGNNLGNTLIGNAAANTLTGGTGNDILNGGAGIDTMIGGAGNDIYIVDNINDVVTELVNGGTDEVQASVTYTLGANVENLTLTGTAAINGYGNSAANIITGNTGNNILDGKGGADTLIGGKGNDTYIVDDEDDVVVENLNEGIDLVKASVSYTLSDNVENLTLTDASVNGGTAAINGTGNALANTITGNAGNNILDGGAGVDKLIGGAGDDKYIVDLVRTGTTAVNYKVALQDTITEAANAGNDTVQLRLLSGTDYSLMANATTLTLGANLENLDASATGTTKLNLTGNALANTLKGNDADNILDGGAGNDILIGGKGNDTLKGGAGADVFKWELGDGGSAGDNRSTDTITDFSISQSDQLDLRDLLVGESENDILNYISIEASGNTTVLHISTTGQFSGGDYHADQEDARITLSNINLQAATGTSSSADLLHHMISSQSLLINNSLPIVD